MLLPIFGTTAIVLALIGWLQHGEGIGDAIFKTLGVLSAGGTYGQSSDWPGNWWIAVARWFGFVFFLMTAKKAFGLVLSNQLADMSAQWRSHDVVLIGDHPAFHEIAAIVSKHKSLLWVATAAVMRRKTLTMISRRWSDALISNFALTRADFVVIGYQDDDMQAVAVAKAFASQPPPGELMLLSSQLGAHEGLQSMDMLRGVRLVSPEKALARSLHETFPPYRIARESGQARIHALFIGCGEMGEQILRDLVLSSLTTFLGKPRATIVDPNAEEIVASLKVRAPEIELSVDIVALKTVGGSDPRALAIEKLDAASEATPFTLAYVCLRDDSAAMGAALALERLSAREGWGINRIFVRQRSSHVEFGAATAGQLGILVPFGTPEQLAIGIGLLRDSTNQVARALHEGYCRFAPGEAVSSQGWDDLSEDMRDANRALLMHLPAKLASAGIDSEPLSAALPKFGESLKDTALLERLAESEHERWMAQRRLSGWRYAPQRDNTRRFHPDLIPYPALSEPAKEKDRQMIRSLAQVLAAGAISEHP